jgi:hypothetical protein
MALIYTKIIKAQREETKMFCKNCGTENAEGSKFCKKCGTPLDGTSTQTNGGSTQTPDTNQVTTGSKFDVNQLLEKVKALPIKALVGACVAVVVLIVIIICVAANLGKEINLNKYITVTTDGYDGYGTAKVSVDWDAIEKKYGSELSYGSKAKSEYGGFLSLTTPVGVLEDCVSVELDNTSKLSNGDVINYTWTVKDNLSDYVKCKVKYKDDSYTVSNLTKVDKFDAFANVDVTFSGTSPAGKATLKYNGSDFNSYDFSISKSSGLSNGDKITVSLSDSTIQTYVKKKGRMPEVSEKEYTVDGLESYLTKNSEINAASLATLQNQATDVYNAYVASTFGSSESLESFTYLGDYLLTAKSSSSYNQNCLYLVYKAAIHETFSNSSSTYDETNNIYWYIAFTDVKVKGDGNLDVDVTKYSTTYNSVTIDSGVKSGWSNKTWYYKGYESLGDLYKATVTKNIDNYNHEDNVKE